jgi:hypothetical protein
MTTYQSLNDAHSSITTLHTGGNEHVSKLSKTQTTLVEFGTQRDQQR